MASPTALSLRPPHRSLGDGGKKHGSAQETPWITGFDKRFHDSWKARLAPKLSSLGLGSLICVLYLSKVSLAVEMLSQLVSRFSAASTTYYLIIGA